MAFKAYLPTLYTPIEQYSYALQACSSSLPYVCVHLFVCVCRLLGCRGVQSFAKDYFPSQSRVVVCGGGVVGCSVAYHLAKEGITDVLLLEQGRYS